MSALNLLDILYPWRRIAHLYALVQRHEHTIATQRREREVLQVKLRELKAQLDRLL